MADYSKSTVAALRQLLKDRGIPSTGLTRKAQIVEKLEAHDKEQNGTVVGLEANSAASEPEVAQEAGETQDEAASTTGDLATPEKTEPDPMKEPTVDAAQSQPGSTVETPTEEQEQSMSTESIAPPEEVAQTTPEKQSTPAEEVDPTVIEEQSALVQDTPPVLEKQSTPTPEPQTQMETQQGVKTPSPDPNEKPSVEKPELLPNTEGSVNTTADVSRLNTEELEADTRKRKRRSGSPELPSQDVRAKKPRPSQDVVHLEKDEDVAMEQRQPEIETESKTEGASAYEPEAIKTADISVAEESKPSHIERKEKAPQYKALFEPAAPTASTDLPLDDRPIVPALHAATPAIYIRNFMRPLKPEPLRAHLISLATPPSASPNSTILKTLFLDSMKTHAFVLFNTTSAASRVRASLHGSIWPAEGNRKELWVDFVPEDSVESWIRSEEDAILAEKSARAAGAPIPAKRFEVVYPDTGDGVHAVFQEVGAGGGSGAPLNAPRGPKSNIEQRRDMPPARQQYPVVAGESARKDLGQSFQTLDSLFESTTAKPKLYYLPVSDARSDARLADLDKETSRDWRPEDRVRGRGRGNLDQKVKISFDSEDRIIETGMDHGPWTEDGGFRGGRGGRGGGYRGDAYRGDGYRGGGGFRGGRGWRG